MSNTMIHLTQYNKYAHLQNNNLIKKHSDDAGWDIRLPFDVELPPQTNRNIATGLHVMIPPGFMGLIKSRSSLALMEDIECSNAGVIDAGYHGEILLKLYNHSPSRPTFLQTLQRVAQLLIVPSLTCDVSSLYFSQQVLEMDISEWPTTDRGTSGIGSTGKI